MIEKTTNFARNRIIRKIKVPQILYVYPVRVLQHFRSTHVSEVTDHDT